MDPVLEGSLASSAQITRVNKSPSCAFRAMGREDGGRVQLPLISSGQALSDEIAIDVHYATSLRAFLAQVQSQTVPWGMQYSHSIGQKYKQLCVSFPL